MTWNIFLKFQPSATSNCFVFNLICSILLCRNAEYKFVQLYKEVSKKNLEIQLMQLQG